MNHLKMLAIASAMSLVLGCANAAPEYLPTDKQVELTGVIEQAYGVDANYHKRQYEFLKLLAPVSVDQDEFGDRVSNITKIQLVFDHDIGVNMSALFMKKVVVTGQLFHGYSPYHFTKVLIIVDKIQKEKIEGTAH